MTWPRVRRPPRADCATARVKSRYGGGNCAVAIEEGQKSCPVRLTPCQQGGVNASRTSSTVCCFRGLLQGAHFQVESGPPWQLQSKVDDDQPNHQRRGDERREGPCNRRQRFASGDEQEYPEEEPEKGYVRVLKGKDQSPKEFEMEFAPAGGIAANPCYGCEL